MDIKYLKDDLIETLEGINKDEMDLCSLKEYAEIVRVVSDIKSKDPIEALGEVMNGATLAMGAGFNGPGPRTVRELKERKHSFEGEED